MTATTSLCISELQVESQVTNLLQTDSHLQTHMPCKGRGLGDHPAIRKLLVGVAVLFLGQKTHYYSFSVNFCFRFCGDLLS